MDINPASWHIEIINTLQNKGLATRLVGQSGFVLLEVKPASANIPERVLMLNLLEAPFIRQPEDLIAVKEHYKEQEINLIHLWRDVWVSRSAQVISRIMSLLSISQRNVHGRQTAIVAISQEEADQFMEHHHLQGPVKSRYKIALVLKGEMVAVATFSAKRKMTRIHDDYYSVELIRYVNASGLNVQGGFSKLLKYMVNLLQPNDFMTYADLDWSSGAAYEKIGFKLVEQQPPSLIWLNQASGKRYFPHRLPEDYDLNQDAYIPLFNSGNLKYILYL